MAKSMKNQKRAAEKLLETRVGLIQACLDEGILTRKDICKSTGLKMYELADVFTKNSELYSLYKVRRRTIKDVAVDNLHDIVNDKNHPHNFQASKWIATSFKTELDEVLESSDATSIQIDPEGGSSNPITITFSRDSDKKNNDKDSE